MGLFFLELHIMYILPRFFLKTLHDEQRLHTTTFRIRATGYF